MKSWRDTAFWPRKLDISRPSLLVYPRPHPNSWKSVFRKFWVVGKKIWKNFFLVKISTTKNFFQKKNPMRQNFRKSDFQILAEGSKSEISGYPKLKRAICQIFRITGISIFRKFRGVGKKFWKNFFLVKISTKNFFFRKKNPITQNIRIADFRENVDFRGSVQKRCYMGFLTTFWHYFWIFPHMCMPGSVPSKFRKNQNDLETSSK